MSRPSHVPVCRLHYLTAARSANAEWRRASNGTYGAITRDERGRQQVELDAVETVEGRVFTPEAIARALGTPTKNPHHERRKANELQRLAFGLTINADQDFYSKSETEAFALACVEHCNRQWRTFLMLNRNPIK